MNMYQVSYILKSCGLFVLLCFTFLLDHVGNCVPVTDKGASLKSTLEGFPLLFQIFLFGFEGWGMELEDVWEGFLQH